MKLQETNGMIKNIKNVRQIFLFLEFYSRIYRKIKLTTGYSVFTALCAEHFVFSEFFLIKT